MHVLFLTHSFPRYAGDAAGSFLLRLAVALRDEGVTVRVLAPAAPELPETDTIEGIAVRRFRYAPASQQTLAYHGTMVEQVRSRWGARLALLGLLGAEVGAIRRGRRESAASLVHAHWWFPSGVPAAFVASPRFPLVTTVHGSDVRLARAIPPARRGLAWVVKRSTAFTAVSRWLGDAVREMVPHAQPQVAPMPVAADLFTPPDSRPRDRLLFVGRLNRQKGLERLLRAMPSIRPGVTLDVVGAGELDASLRALAGEIGIAERVRWHGGLPHHRLPAFYRQATALVVPSEEEGLGLVAAEAALCGAPVVAFDSGGLRDVVLHERTGLLAAPVSVEALASAVDTLLAMPDQGAHLGVAGREHALATVSPHAAARRYADIYRSAIARPS